MASAVMIRAPREGDLHALADQAEQLGYPVDPDLIFRSLEYAIEPEWTRGHRFAVAYELVGKGGGTWRVEVDDGSVRVERGLGQGADAIVRIRYSDWVSLLSGELTPPDSAALLRAMVVRSTSRLPPRMRMPPPSEFADVLSVIELSRTVSELASEAVAWLKIPPPPESPKSTPGIDLAQCRSRPRHRCWYGRRRADPFPDGHRRDRTRPWIDLAGARYAQVNEVPSLRTPDQSAGVTV